MMLKGWPRAKSASSPLLRLVAEFGSSHLPKRKKSSISLGKPGTPVSVWATMRTGLSCSQINKICGSERTMASADARLCLSFAFSFCASFASRWAVPVIIHMKMSARTPVAASSPISGTPSSVSNELGNPPAEVTPATSTRTQAKLASRSAMSSRRSLPNFPIFLADCIGIQ